MTVAAEFNTSEEIRQVENFGKSIDALNANLRKLNASSLDQLSKQIKDLGSHESNAVRLAASKMQTSVQTLQAMLTTSGKNVQSFMRDAAREGVATLAYQQQAMLKLITTHTREKLQAAKFAAEEEKRIGAKMDADWVASKIAAHTRVEKMVEVMAIKARVMATTEAMTAAPLSAAKPGARIASYTPYNAQTVLSKELSESARYQTRLQAMAAAQSEADAKYIALRKDSLARGKITIVAAAKASAAELNAATAAALANKKANIGNTNRALGGAEVLGEFTPYDALMNKSKAAPGLLGKFGSSLKALSGDMGDTHSAARGLASGLDLLWLTWGNLVPLFAGAAVSFGLRAVVEQGSKVQDTLLSIKTLAGATLPEVAALNFQMLELARTGPFGPQQIADAMKTLALAGLDAKDVYATMPELLAFSVAGATDVKNAAEALTTIGTAFNITAGNYGHISDVVSKAAAESKSSVESMSEAFKTASVIHQQYGVSLLDTATGLSLLANAGIQGTAAGTALRNMYADLSGRTPKVSQALKKLGVDVLEVNGSMKNQGQIFAELMTGLDKYTGKDKIGILNQIFSERGGKEAIAVINSIEKTIANSKGTITSYAEAYAKLQESIKNSEGFAIVAAAEQGLSPLNQMKEVATSLSAALVGAFNELQPFVLRLSNQLQELFNSDKFRNGIKDFVTALATLLVKFAEVSNILIPLGTGLVALNFAFKALAGATVVYAVATAEAATATTVLTAVMRANPIGLLVSVILAAGAAWFTYKTAVGESKTAHDSFSGSSFKDIGDKLEQEVERLEKVNKARREGISLMEVEAKAALASAEANGQAGVVAAEAELAKAQNDRKTLDGRRFANSEKIIAASESRVTDAQNAVLEAKRDIVRQKARNEYLIQELARLRRDQNTSLPGAKPTPIGTQNWDEGGSSRFGAKDRTLTAKDAKDRFDAIKQAGAAELALVQSQYDTRRQVLEAWHAAGRTAEGEYQFELLALITKAEADKRKAISTEQADLEKDSARFIAERKAQYKFDIENYKGSAAQLQEVTKAKNKDLESDLDAHNEKLVAATKQNATELAKLDTEKYLRMEKAAADYYKEITKLQKEADDFLGEVAATDKKARATEDLAKQYANVSESSMTFMKAEKAAAYAAMESSAQFDVMIAKMERALEVSIAAAETYKASFLASGVGGNEEISVAIDNLEASVKRNQALLGKLRSEQGKTAATSASKAFDKVIDEDVARLQKSTADAIETALWEGGAAGKAKLRDLIVAELKKPIRLIIDAVVNPVVGSILGSMGMAGTANAGGAGGFGNIGSIGAGFSSFSKTGFGSSLGLSENMYDGFPEMGTNYQMTDLGKEWAGYAETAGQVLGYASALTTAFSRNAQGGKDYGKAIGQAVGTYIGGPVGSMILGEIGSALGLVDYGGTYHTGGIGSYSRSGGAKTGAAALTGGMSFDLAAKDYSVAGEKAAAGFAKGLVGVLDSTATMFGKKAGYQVSTAFADDISPDGAWGALFVKLGETTLVDWKDGKDQWPGREFADGGAGMKEYQVAVAKDVRDYLVTQVPDWADAALIALGDSVSIESLTEAMTQINATEEALQGMGRASEAFADMGEDVSSRLVEALGGAAAAAVKLGGYYAKFYSDTERQAITRQQLQDAATASGLGALPTDRAGYRALVDLTKKSGNTELVGTLIDYSEAFASTTEAISTGAAAVDSSSTVVDTYAQKTTSLLEEGANLQVELLKAQGLTAEATAVELAKATEGLDLYQASLVVSNISLQRQIKAATEKSDLDKQLLEAEGDTKALRALELANLEPGNRAMQERVWLLQDEKTATEAFWSAADGMVDRLFSAAEAKTYKVTNIAKGLTKAGVTSGDTSVDVAFLAGLSADDIKKFAKSFVALHGEADPASTAVLTAAGALLDLKDAAKTAFESLKSSAFSSVDRYLDKIGARQFKLYILAEKLSAAGMSGSVDSISAMLGQLDQTTLKDAVAALMQLPDVTTEAKMAVLDVGNSLLDMAEASKTANKAIQDQVDSLLEYVKKLKGERAGLATPTQLLEAKRADYIEKLGLARSGDTAAITALTGTAQEYIEAQKGYSASSSYTQAVIDQVIAEITALAGGISSTIPGFASGGYHEGGWAMVGERGRELIYTPPSHVFNAGQTASMVGSGADTAEEVRLLRLQFAEWQRQQDEQTAALIQHNYAAQSQNANAVVSGVSKATKQAVYSASNKPEVV